MFNFACRDMSLEEIMECAFRLKNSDYVILNYLMKNGKSDVYSMADSLGFDRSTVQKSLKRLVGKDLVHKRQLNISSGGYKYVYTPREKKEIRNKVLEMIDAWTESAKERLGNW